MKIYFDYGTDEQPGHPPLAIDVAKALIEISMDRISDFGGDDFGPTDWLNEIADHLQAHTRAVRGHIVRKNRRSFNGN